MKILLTGGGTSGHVTPLLAVVSEIRKIAAEKKLEKLEFMLISPENENGGNVFEGGIKIKKIKAGKLRRYFSLENILDFFQIPIGMIQSMYYVYKFKPDVVFSKGGYASVPPVAASWFLRIPILTHESDIVPGLANKIISYFSTKIFISFPDAEKYFNSEKTLLTGNPIREEVIGGDKSRAMDTFNLRENIPTILIYGGSQGARKINEVILESLPEIIKKYQIIHLCGEKNFEQIKKDAKLINMENKERYKVYPFLTAQLKDAYAICDIVISRAGANSLAEIIALEKPSIIIPLPSSAGNHQLENAQFFEKKGMIVLIEEKDLTCQNLVSEIDNLFLNRKGEGIKERIKKYKSLNIQNPTRLIAEEVLKYTI